MWEAKIEGGRQFLCILLDATLPPEGTISLEANSEYSYKGPGANTPSSAS